MTLRAVVRPEGGGGGAVNSVTGNAVNNTDPTNPVIDYPTSANPYVLGRSTTGGLPPVALPLSAAATATTVALRSGTGTLTGAAPVAATDLTNKTYVDGLTTPLGTRITTLENTNQPWNGYLTGTPNLNDYTSRGTWGIATNAIASGGTNFPAAVAGYLTVFSPVATGTTTNQVYQMYYSSGSNTLYSRTLNTGVWSAWDQYVTSATTVVLQTSVVDTTPGRAMRTGGFGLGAVAPNVSTYGFAADFNVIDTIFCLVTIDVNMANGPNGATAASYPGVLRVQRRAFTAGASVTQELFLPNSVVWKRTGTGAVGAVTWSAWDRILGSTELGVANGIATLDANARLPITQMSRTVRLPATAHDLNNYQDPGLYFQASNGGAAAGTNYPTPLSGYLEVIGEGDPVALQRYTVRIGTQQGQTVWIRNRTSTPGVWAPWVQIPNWSNSINFIGDLGASQDLNTYTQRGVWTQGSSANAASGTNYPIAQSGVLLVYSGGYPGGTTATSAEQIYIAANSNRMWLRSEVTGVWSAWSEVLLSPLLGVANGIATLGADGKVPTSQLQIIPPIALGAAVDLNTITTSGWYSQNNNAGAAGGTNYPPTQQAGQLFVYNGSTNTLFQEYTNYGGGAYGGRKYWRAATNNTGATWGAWREVGTAADIATAQSTANTALSNAATAQTTANTANSTANSAATAASNAQTTANTAVTNAAAAQSDVDALEPRVTTLEGQYSSLNTRMGNAETNITALQGNMSAATTNITDLQNLIIGENQAMQTVSRTSGTAYTNTTGRPIMAILSGTVGAAGAHLGIQVDAAIFATRQIYNDALLVGANVAVWCMIPPGLTYYYVWADLTSVVVREYR